jgi:hypothetical protein
VHVGGQRAEDRQVALVHQAVLLGQRPCRGEPALAGPAFGGLDEEVAVPARDGVGRREGGELQRQGGGEDEEAGNAAVIPWDGRGARTGS